MVQFNQLSNRNYLIDVYAYSLEFQYSQLASTLFGFAVMELYMDEVVVLSEKDVGTKIVMRKKISEK